jgi:ribosomal protein S18 acetylase RimI-like enzyme
MKIILRPTNQSDFAFLKEVYRSTREHDVTNTGWTEEKKNSFIEFQFNAQHAHYLSTYKNAVFNIIILNKTNIGRLYIWETETQLRLIDITLLPEFRNKGIGTNILKKLIDKSNKIEKVLNLHVLQNNPALKLYKLLGFKIKEKRNTHLFMERLPDKKS